MRITARCTGRMDDAPVLLCTNVATQPPCDLELREWLETSHPILSAQLNSTGGVLLRGFSERLGEEAFSIVLASMGTPMDDYIGGSTPRRKIGSRTYTATELAGDYSIALHQEMSYLPVAPAAIAFYCVRKAVSGGRSILADAREVARRIPPEVVESFRKKGILITRSLPAAGSLYLASGVSRPWQEVFGTDDPASVDQTAALRGWNASWCADGTLRLNHGTATAFRPHPSAGGEVWFNQAHYYSPDCMLQWAQRDQRTPQERYIKRLLDRADTDHLNAVSYADGSPIPPRFLLAIWDTLAAAERPVDLLAGDILLLDNYYVMHGREQFSGSRSLQAGLIASLA